MTNLRARHTLATSIYCLQGGVASVLDSSRDCPDTMSGEWEDGDAVDLTPASMAKVTHLLKSMLTLLKHPPKYSA
ncbi:hypothetical protein BaRGS_00007133 [Batillaria attramentaria]|uniref:Uncharacterized protein n=1 Tax=Batillaria attramentaria TaxID=370345 RepID=A0ABD0LRP3_9CAEN